MGVLFDVMFLNHLAADIGFFRQLNQLLGGGRISQSGVRGYEKDAAVGIISHDAFSRFVTAGRATPERHALSYPVLCKQFGTRCGFMFGSDELFAIYIEVYECSH
jgi:hypothetical protein